jgi:uncharacterized membrane protein
MAIPDASSGKRPRAVTAGPYGHPVHPMVVTVPIGAWVSSVVLDIASMAKDDTALAQASVWLIAIGVVGALLAAVFGSLDLTTIPRGTKAFTTGITHMSLNLVAVAVFAIDYGLRVKQSTPSVPTTGFILSLVGLALIGASGWLGGKLAYHYGVRVADERTRAQGF